MLTGSIKPGDSRKPGCGIWTESDSGFVDNYGRGELNVVNSVHEDLLALLVVLEFFLKP